MHSRVSFFFVILLCATVGAALGILSSSFALIHWLTPVPVSESSSLSAYRESRTESTGTNIAVAQDSMVALFSSKPKEGAWLSLSQAQGIGVALTADGLLISASKPGDATVGLSSRTIVAVRPVAPPVAKIHIDNKHDLSLFTIAPLASSAPRPELKATTFASFDALFVGQEVVVFHPGGVASFHHIVALGSSLAAALPRSSEDMVSAYLAIDGGLEPGLPLVTAQGELVGFTGNGGTVVLGEIINGMLKHYLKNEGLVHTYLGVFGIDISSLGGGASALPPGFLIQSAPGASGIVSKSPADIAGIKEGDLLLSFDGQRLNGRTPLQVLLQRYPSGAEVPILLLREGKELTVKVALSSK